MRLQSCKIWTRESSNLMIGDNVAKAISENHCIVAELELPSFYQCTVSTVAAVSCFVVSIIVPV